MPSLPNTRRNRPDSLDPKDQIVNVNRPSPNRPQRHTHVQQVARDQRSLEDAVRAYRIKLAVHCDNLANADSIAYKRYRVELRPGNLTVNWSDKLKTGSGVHVSPVIDLTQGSIEQTGNPFNVAIEGDGYFKILLPDGSERYTRDGAFRLNAQGEIVTGDGYALADSIQIPQGADNVTINVDGTVTYLLNGQGTPQTTGPIQLSRFPNPAGLSNEGGNLYAATEASGQEVLGIAGEHGAGRLRCQFLERSNVDLETERRHLEETTAKLFMFEKLLKLR